MLSAARHLAITSPSPGLSPRATSSEDASGMRWDRTGRDGMATRQLWAPSPRRGWPRCLAAVLMPIPGAGLFGGETRRDWEKHLFHLGSSLWEAAGARAELRVRLVKTSSSAPGGCFARRWSRRGSGVCWSRAALRLPAAPGAGVRSSPCTQPGAQPPHGAGDTGVTGGLPCRGAVPAALGRGPGWGQV